MVLQGMSDVVILKGMSDSVFMGNTRLFLPGMPDTECLL